MFLKKNNLSDQQTLKAVIVGVGGAGLQVLDRLVLRGVQEAEMIALDTDSRNLASSVVNKKIQIGRKLTRGLDTGGDPDIGARAIAESLPEFLEALADASLVFLIAGLGGGTGTGVLPELARKAAQRGAKIIGLVTLPFSFEGLRRDEQAREGLNKLVSCCDAIYLLPNDSVLSVAGQDSSAFEAFEISDDVLGEVSRGLCQMLIHKGVLSVEWQEVVDMLQSSVRGLGRYCWAGWGGDNSEDRTRVVIERILSGPFLGNKVIREKVDEVLISLTGGTNMLFSEVEFVFREIRSAFPQNANIRLAACLNDQSGDELSVLVIAAETQNTATKESLPNGTEEKSFTTDQTPSVATLDISKTIPEISILSKGLEESKTLIAAHSPIPSDQTEKNDAEIKTNLHLIESSEKTEVNKTIFKTQEDRTPVTPESTLDANLLPEEQIRKESSPTNLFESSVHQQEQTERTDPKNFVSTELPLAQVSSNELKTNNPPYTDQDHAENSEPLDTIKVADLFSGSDKQKSPSISILNDQISAVESFTSISESQHKTNQEPSIDTVPRIPTKGSEKIQSNASGQQLERTQRIPPLVQDKEAQKNNFEKKILSKPDLNPHIPDNSVRQTSQPQVYFIREPEQVEPVSTAHSEVRQEILQFDTVSKGRFEQTDATVYNGENLDIPTFLRKQLHIRQVVD